MADQPKCVYTAVTFAPVQGFIENSETFCMFFKNIGLSSMSKSYQVI